MSILLALAAAATAPALTPDQRVVRMAALYDRICLQTFPDDNAVAAIMRSMNARELTREEVRTTMRDDPARGWQLADRSATVWIEFPPYHACSVRWSSPAIGNLAPYRAIADRYERTRPGFRPVRPQEMDQGDIHIRAMGKRRMLPDRSMESLYIFDQHITNPARRAAGETGVSIRFVHQFAPLGS